MYHEINPNTNTASPRPYLLATFPGVHFELQSTDAGWIITTPPGVDWSDPQEPDEEGNPRPNIPRDPWTWYQQQYGIEAAQPTPQQVLAYEPTAPEGPAPVTDVEIYKEVFVTARKNATLLIDTIKASVQDALVKSKAYSRSDATIQGVDFVFCHGDAISKYKEAGGHPAAASKLLSAFKSEGSVALFPWVKSVGAIFDQALTY